MKMPPTVTIPGKTLNELIQHWASTSDWDIPAFISLTASGERKSCINRKEVLEYAGRFAYKLSQAGVTKGCIVYSSLPNSIERVICDFGIFLNGATSLNGQIFHSDGCDFLNSMKASKAQYVIIDPSFENGPYKILQRIGLEFDDGHVKCKSLPHLHKIIFVQRNSQEPSQDFLNSLNNPTLNKIFANTEPSELATVMTTSGSTGYSKLVRLTHANLCHFTIQVKTIEPFKGGERFINCAPLGWAGGFPQWYLGMGITRYFIDMYEGPPENMAWTIWQAIMKEKIEYGFLSPMYVSEIFRNHSWWSDSEWKPNVICMAGQPIKRSQLDIIGKICNAVDINYGMTECNVLTTHRITDPNTFVERCSGFPGNGVSLKVVDEERNELRRGVMGEILLKSPALFLGYLNNDEVNSRAFTSDGWLCTDDAGYMDSEGRVFVEGRQSDSILRGTYILYPSWLEQEIKKLDKVKDVVIVPVPDPILHNEICACVLTDCVKDVTVESTDAHQSLSSSNCNPQITNEMYDKSLVASEKSFVNDINSNEGNTSFIDVSKVSHSMKLEQIRFLGMKKSLNVDYNLTKAKSDDSSNLCMTTAENGSDNDKKSPLKELESEIRWCCDKSQALAKKDAMRMVPKYYVFCQKFPTTGTGKLNRKEIRLQALVALELV